MGLSGLGDLVLTCSSEQSRNFSSGSRWGEAKRRSRAAEGSLSKALHLRHSDRFAHRQSVDMPICAAVERARGIIEIDAVIEACGSASEGELACSCAGPIIRQVDRKIDGALADQERAVKWSWAMQVEAGEKGTFWNGVRNHLAKKHLKEMKVGDQAFFYHSSEGKEIVGIVEVIKGYYPDHWTRPAYSAWLM